MGCEAGLALGRRRRQRFLHSGDPVQGVGPLDVFKRCLALSYPCFASIIDEDENPICCASRAQPGEETPVFRDDEPLLEGLEHQGSVPRV